MIKITMGKLDCFSTTEMKKIVWSAGDPLRCLLVPSYPVTQVTGKVQQPNPGRMAMGTDPSGMKVWVTLRKEPRSTEVPAEGGGNTEWIVEEDPYKLQLKPHDQLHKWIIIDMSVCPIFKMFI